VRVFVAGASGVLGIRLLPLLRQEGHVVAGMTRSPAKTPMLSSLGAEPVVCDVFDAARLEGVVTTFAPDVVLDQLTDLPDRVEGLADAAARNDRMRTEGTRNLIAAARAARAIRFLAQSIAWRPPGRGEVVEQHEQQVLAIGGVIVRYGRLYGPGTYYETEPPPDPRIHIDEAAKATLPLLDLRSAVVTIADPQ
jgi:hypothetical protein